MVGAVAEHGPPGPVPLAATSAGERGSLEIRDKVVAVIAARAATGVDGVLPHASTAGRFTGRGLPRIDATIVAGHVHADVRIALTWPTPAGPAAAAVRDAVARDLTTLTGLAVDGVDIAIAQILPAGGADTRRVS